MVLCSLISWEDPVILVERKQRLVGEPCLSRASLVGYVAFTFAVICQRRENRWRREMNRKKEAFVWEFKRVRFFTVFILFFVKGDSLYMSYIYLHKFYRDSYVSRSVLVRKP